MKCLDATGTLPQYRDKHIARTFRKDNTDGFMFADVECIIAEFKDGTYWIIPNDSEHDDEFEAIGPFETLAVVAVYAKLRTGS